MPESPPKRITRSRAKAAEMAKAPSKPVKIATAAPRATSTVRRKAVPDEIKETAVKAKRPDRVVKVTAVAPKATRTAAKGNAASEEIEPPAEKAKLPGNTEKVPAVAPKPTRTAAKRNVVPSESTKDVEPVKKTRGRPKKPISGTDQQIDDGAANEPKPATAPAAQPPKRPRGRPKKSDDQDAPKPEALPKPPSPPPCTAPASPERLTLGRMAPPTRGIPPVKKRVTFADDVIDKENRIPPRAAGVKRSANVAEDDVTKKPRGLNAKPIRRATSTKSTRAKKTPTAETTSKEPDKTEVKPLSPTKAQQNAMPGIASPPKKPPPSPFKEALKDSPKRINLSTSFLSLSPSKSTLSAQATVRSLASPPKRDTPKSINLSTSVLSQSASKFTISAQPAVKSLASPPKRDTPKPVNLSTPVLSQSPSKSTLSAQATVKSLASPPKRDTPEPISLSTPVLSQSPSKFVISAQPAIKTLAPSPTGPAFTPPIKPTSPIKTSSIKVSTTFEAAASQYRDENSSLPSVKSMAPSPEMPVFTPPIKASSPIKTPSVRVSTTFEAAASQYGNENSSLPGLKTLAPSPKRPVFTPPIKSSSPIKAPSIKVSTTVEAAASQYGNENSIYIDPALLELTAEPTSQHGDGNSMPIDPVLLELTARQRGALTPRRRSNKHTPMRAVFEGWSTMETPMRTPRPEGYSQILRGAVVFVDVHTSEGADASSLFVDLLTQMGARCVKQWNWNPTHSAISNGDSSDGQNNLPKIGITHVVFKDGGKRTLEKVRESGGVVLCVAVAWVLDCERQNSWLDETSYAVDTSLVPRGGQRRRKSMEPRALSSSTTTPEMSGSFLARKYLNLDSSSPPMTIDTPHIQNNIPTPRTPHFPALSSYSDLSDCETTMETPYFLKPSQITQRTCPPKPTHQIDFGATPAHGLRPPLNFGTGDISPVHQRKRLFDSDDDDDAAEGSHPTKKARVPSSLLNPAQTLQQTCPPKPTQQTDLSATAPHGLKRPLNFNVSDISPVHQRKRFFDDNAEDSHPTKKPRLSSSLTRPHFPISGKIEDCPSSALRARLLAARRRSLMWAPKVASPLRQAVGRESTG